VGVTGDFTLSFRGATTDSLPFNVPANGGSMRDDSLENALNALSTIGGVGGSVSVSQSGNVYTINFGGTLAQSHLPLLVAVGNAGTTASVTQVTPGSTGTAIAGDLQIGDTVTGNAVTQW